MKRVIAIAALSLSLISSQACADEHRGGDAALGALSGAVVLGPVGAVAGAVVGYTAGPSIARSWGFRRSSHAAPRTKAVKREASAPEARSSAEGKAGAAPAAAAPPSRTASKAPPVQTLE
jgi:hypothetical protein